MAIEIKADPGFRNRMKGRVEKYRFEVGILDFKQRRSALDKSAGLKSFPGGKARRTGKKANANITNDFVSSRMRKKLKFNFYKRPFNMKANRDLLRMLKAFFDLIGGRSKIKRLENTLQAVVRNPILRGDYGKNSTKTARRKGFNKLMVDTGQLFRNIKAKVFRRV